VRRYLDTCAREAVESGRLRSASGRLVAFDVDPADRSSRARVERQGKNAPMQATNADALKRAMVLADESLRPLRARIVNAVHDELLVEGPAELAAEIKRTLESAIVAGVGEYVPSVPIAVSIDVSAHWSKEGARSLLVPERAQNFGIAL